MFEQLFWAIEPNALAQLFDRLTAYQEQGQKQAQEQAQEQGQASLGDASGGAHSSDEHGYTVENGVALLLIDKLLLLGIPTMAVQMVPLLHHLHQLGKSQPVTSKF